MSAPVFLAQFGDITVTSTDGRSYVATRGKFTGVGSTAGDAMTDLFANEKRRAS